MNRMTIAVAAVSATLLALSAGSASAEVRNFEGLRDSRSGACTDAKAQAERIMQIRGWRLQRFGSCECSQERHSDGSLSRLWRCNVDAYYTRD